MPEHKTVYVCVGSSCYIKGSYRIMELMRKSIADNGLEDKVVLKAAFCLGECANGVSIRVNDQIVSGVSEANFQDVFNMYILAV